MWLKTLYGTIQDDKIYYDDTYCYLDKSYHLNGTGYFLVERDTFYGYYYLYRYLILMN